MSERETRSFLESNDHGVLSLGVENRGYGFPISYTYDEANARILLGFVSPPESKKREFAAEADKATFTVYTHEDVDSWKSAIVEGPIRPVDGDDTSHRVPDIVFSREREDADGDDGVVNLDKFERTWYELRIDAISGRWSGL
jgi:nitroimidazol reductase NimA-like FMN-containing flavoprotein (pyridoxamine 5'-phosphate oxidase superfamily)